jgi:uncharacterized protein YceK
LTILSVTSGCAHVSTTQPAINSYCAIAQPMRYNSKSDSAGTVEQIEAHNSTWVCLCGSPPDCPE